MRRRLPHSRSPCQEGHRHKLHRLRCPERHHHRWNRHLRAERRPQPLHGGSAAGGDLHGFGAIRTLAGLEDEAKARSVLESVARDPGILAVMRQRRWFVPELVEMYPDGKVGEDPVCVLGLNVNMGQQIQLRIRTDNLLGFRYRAVIMQTLWHELAHNARSEHDAAFYALVSELTREGERLDWTRGAGHTTGGGDEAVFRGQHAGGAGHAAAPAFVGGSGAIGGSATASRLVDEAGALRAAAAPTSSAPAAPAATATAVAPSAPAAAPAAASTSALPQPAPPAPSAPALPPPPAAATAAADAAVPEELAAASDALGARRAALQRLAAALAAAAGGGEAGREALATVEGIVDRAMRAAEEKHRAIRTTNAAFLARMRGGAAAAAAFLQAAGFRAGDAPEWLRLGADADFANAYLARETLREAAAAAL